MNDQFNPDQRNAGAILLPIARAAIARELGRNAAAPEDAPSAVRTRTAAEPGQKWV